MYRTMLSAKPDAQLLMRFYQNLQSQRYSFSNIVAIEFPRHTQIQWCPGFPDTNPRTLDYNTITMTQAIDIFTMEFWTFRYVNHHGGHVYRFLFARDVECTPTTMKYIIGTSSWGDPNALLTLLSQICIRRSLRILRGKLLSWQFQRSLTYDYLWTSVSVEGTIRFLEVSTQRPTTGNRNLLNTIFLWRGHEL